jgi:small subunit ribosomal protein S18
MKRRITKRPFPTDIARLGFVHPTNMPIIAQYLSKQGRIVPRYYTNVTLQQQRRIARSIKWARELGMLPYLK